MESKTEILRWKNAAHGGELLFDWRTAAYARTEMSRFSDRLFHGFDRFPVQNLLILSINLIDMKRTMKPFGLILVALGILLPCRADDALEKKLADARQRLGVLEKMKNGDYKKSPPKQDWEKRIIMEEIEKVLPSKIPSFRTACLNGTQSVFGYIHSCIEVSFLNSWFSRSMITLEAASWARRRN